MWDNCLSSWCQEGYIWITSSCGSDSVLKTSPINVSLSTTVRIFRPYFAAIASRTQHKSLCDYTVSSKRFTIVSVASNCNFMKVASILGFGSGEWMIPSLARVLSTLINHPNYTHYSSFLPQLPRCNEFSSVADFPPSKRCRSISCLCVSSARSKRSVRCVRERKLVGQ